MRTAHRLRTLRRVTSFLLLRLQICSGQVPAAPSVAHPVVANRSRASTDTSGRGQVVEIKERVRRRPGRGVQGERCRVSGAWEPQPRHESVDSGWVGAPSQQQHRPARNHVLVNNAGQRGIPVSGSTSWTLPRPSVLCVAHSTQTLVLPVAPTPGPHCKPANRTINTPGYSLRARYP